MNGVSVIVATRAIFESTVKSSSAFGYVISSFWRAFQRLKLDRNLSSSRIAIHTKSRNYYAGSGPFAPSFLPAKGIEDLRTGFKNHWTKRDMVKEIDHPRLVEPIFRIRLSDIGG